MKQLEIKIHSFVDLITNSSTELYVEATAGTLKSIKNLIDNLIKSISPTLSVDQLFDFELKTEVDDEYLFDYAFDYLFSELSNEEMTLSYDLKRKIIKIRLEEVKLQTPRPGWLQDIYNDLKSETKIVVTCKDNNQHLINATEILNNLNNIFSACEHSND